MVGNKVIFKILFCTLFLLSGKYSLAQVELDSLKKLLAISKADTNRLILLGQLADNSPEGEWEKYNEQLGFESKKLLNDKNLKIKRSAMQHQAVYINNCGFIAHHLGDIPKAISCYHQSLEIQEKLGNPTGIALAYNNIGFEYSVQGELENALIFYTKAFEAYKSVNYIEGMALGYNNIAHVKDIKVKEMINRKAPCDSVLTFISEVLMYYQKSLTIHEKIDEKFGVMHGYNNIGALYGLRIKEWKQCGVNADSIIYYQKRELEFLNTSLELAKQLGDSRGVANSMNNIGKHYFENAEFKNAEKYSKEAFSIAKAHNYPANIKDAGKLLYDIYKNTGRFKEALEMHEIFINLRDSIQNDKNRKLGLQKQIQYEYDKKAAADSVKVSAEREIIAAELKQEKTQKIALYVGLSLVVVFSLFITNRFRITQRQKKIIEKQKAEVIHQKELVDEKQKEILDSITYAKRLQQAILPPTQLIDKLIPQNFVLYQPKDIVAGDFYWMHELVDSVLIAAADSTGHGVPGAMVSIVCSNSLDKAVKEFKLTEPGEILDKTTELVLDTFVKSGEEIKDGMDISLLLIDKANKKIKWSGANNQLWYIDPAEPLVMKEVKANKQPVGKSDNQIPFVTHQFDWQAGYIFYLITDGYADQFGGPKGKKYKYKQLEEKLLSITNLSMLEQKQILLNDFENWKGTLEQVDDVTLIAIKLA